MNKWPFLMLYFVTNMVRASLEEAHQQGKAFAETMKESAVQNTQVKIDKDRVPGFETVHPAQSDLNPNGDFQEAIQSALKSEAGQTLFESSDKRARYKLNPKTDPLFLQLNNQALEKSLDIEIELKQEKEDVEILTCEEGGEAVTYHCDENRQVIPQVPTKTATLTVNHLNFKAVMEPYWIERGFWFHLWRWKIGERQNGWSLSLPKEIDAFKRIFCTNFNPTDVKTGEKFNLDCSRIQSFKINNARSISESNGTLNIVTDDNKLNITLFHDTYEGEAIDEWVSQCTEHEKLVDQGFCQYGERVLSKGPETRNINGYSIFRDAWQYRQNYHCKMIKDECASLSAKGCYQVDSRCKELKQNKCWIYEQSYQCPSGKLSQTKIKSPALQAFCLTGDCHDSSYQANGELLEVISQLNLLKEVQDDIRSQTGSGFQIFKGEDKRCTRNCVSFKDCCGGMKGWGMSLHIAGCSEGEKQLAKMREQGLCHLIGTYCDKKVLKKCVRKKTSFCCFSSKLARILQEQGRSQLGIGWGDERNPVCRALSVEELARIDLSKIDFSEIFSDLMKKYKAPNVKGLQEKTVEKIKENLQPIESSIKKEMPSVKEGRLNDKKDSL